MLRDMLPAIFQLATGLGFLIFLGTAILASAAKTTTWGRLLLVALLLVPLGFLFMSQGVGQSTLGRAAPMLVAGGVAFLIAAVLTAAGVLVLARRPETGNRTA